MTENLPEGTLLRGVAGDWHGNTNWAKNCLYLFSEYGIKRVYQLGDFGVWGGTGGQMYLDDLERVAALLDIELWVTLGNHENYEIVDQVPVGRDGLQWIRPHIGLLPRGHRWEDGGRTFVSLGGAPSIDKFMRHEGISWFPGEAITLEEAERTAAGGYADVMFAHDSPDGGVPAVQEIIDTPPHLSGWPIAMLRYCAEGRSLMNLAFNGVRPKLFMHGHYHVHDDDEEVAEGETRFVCLNLDGMADNVAILRLPDLKLAYPAVQRRSEAIRR